MSAEEFRTSFRALAPGQRCRVRTYDVETGEIRTVLESTTTLFEAPNWTRDARSLILNGAGVLWRLDVGGDGPQRLAITGIPAALNNDHVLDPDGEHVFVSANDGHIYRAPLGGGEAVRVSDPSFDPALLHFLHGVDPSGRTLSFIGLRPEGDDLWARADVYLMSVDGGEYRMLPTGPGPADGAEFSPDGAWVYFNTEGFDGHAQIARVRPDGSGLAQLTSDEHVNWFPHPAPDGRRTVYLAFPPGTAGHPADLWVHLMLVEEDAWDDATPIVRLFGGQGTINVNSWSPDGTRFAYVDYPRTDGG